MERVNVIIKIAAVILFTQSFLFLNGKNVSTDRNASINLTVSFITLRVRKRMTGRQIKNQKLKSVGMLRTVKSV